jgi:hypothetical protein
VAGTEQLGFDVSFDGDGLTSLVARALLRRDPHQPEGESVEPMDQRIRILRQQFVDTLNANLLFPTEEEATRFLRARR